MRVIGLMSGTSLDGIDAALVELPAHPPSDPADGFPWRLEAFLSVPYPPGRRAEIHDAIVKGSAAALCTLHADLGEWLAEAVLALCDDGGCDPAAVDLIGSHGQTIWHQPPTAERRGATLQLGCPATIAERTGIPVVSDFRSRDIAAGGHGAPLVPWVDRLLFAQPGKYRALQNIGGMANVTWIPPRGDPAPILAFDTGPGVALMDAAVELASEGRAFYDVDGERARRGRVDEAFLAELLDHPFFELEPPKSTGRETFGRPTVAALAHRLAPADPAAWDDLVATLTALTARSIANAYNRWILPRGLDEVVLTGGGACNPALHEMIAEALAPVPVHGGEALGLDPNAKEAVAFAVLAWAFALGLPANVPEATGALHPAVLGSFTPGAPDRPLPLSR